MWRIGLSVKLDKGLRGANTANLLHLFDSSFAAATRNSNYAQFEQQFNELTFEKGVEPSAALMRTHQLMQMKFVWQSCFFNSISLDE